MSKKYPIDRNELLRVMEMEAASLIRVRKMERYEGYKMAINDVRNMPQLPIQPAETAYWKEDVSEDRAPKSHYYCTNCRLMVGRSAGFMKYCYNCGATMLGIQDGMI